MAGKRANGEGSVAKRPDGRWEARFSYVDPATGKQKRSSSYGATRAEALSRRKEKRERAAAGQPVKDARITLGEFVGQWIGTSLQASDRKETTKSTYAGLARGHLQGAGIGQVTLDKLKPTDVERLVLTMRDKGLSASTIRQTYTILRAVLDGAVRDGHVARNVAALISRPGVPRTEARFLKPEELKRLFAAAERPVKGKPPSRFATLLRLLAFTGLRRGEGLALRWADVDLEGGVLRVRGTLSRVNGALTITEPKTERSRRSVRISAPLAALLAASREVQDAERAKAGAEWVETGLVFTTEFGRPVEPRNALRALTTAAQRAGLENIGLHTLRHSAASLMLSAGSPLTDVSQMLGHSSVAITGDIYGHVTTDGQQRAADLLAAALAA